MNGSSPVACATITWLLHDRVRMPLVVDRSFCRRWWPMLRYQFLWAHWMKNPFRRLLLLWTDVLVGARSWYPIQSWMFHPYLNRLGLHRFVSKNYRIPNNAWKSNVWNTIDCHRCRINNSLIHREAMQQTKRYLFVSYKNILWLPCCMHVNFMVPVSILILVPKYELTTLFDSNYGGRGRIGELVVAIAQLCNGH